MPDTIPADYADQWVSVADMMDLMDRLNAAMDDDASYQMDVLHAVLSWSADLGLLGHPGPVEAVATRRPAQVVADLIASNGANGNRPEGQCAQAETPPARINGNHAAMAGGVALQDPRPAPAAALGRVPAGVTAPAGGNEPVLGAPVANSPWSDAEVSTARQMLIDGFSGSAIAARLGRPVPATQKKCKVLRKQIAEAKKPATVPEKAGDKGAPAQKPAEPAAQEAPKPVAPALRASTPAGLSPAAGVHKPAPAPAPSRLAAAMPPPSRPAPFTQPDPPGWWRDIDTFLTKLGYRGRWSAEADLILVEGLAKGADKVLLADQLGVDTGELRARFVALTPSGVTIEGQARLLQVLRARAEAQA